MPALAADQDNFISRYCFVSTAPPGLVLEKRIISLLRCSSPVDRVDLLLTRSKPSRDEFHRVWSSLGTGAPRLLPHNQAVSPRPGSPWAARVTALGPADAGAQPTGPSISKPSGPVFPAPDEYRDPLLRTQGRALANPHRGSRLGQSWRLTTEYSVLVHSSQHAHDFGSAVSSSAQRVSSNHPGRDNTHHRPVGDGQGSTRARCTEYRWPGRESRSKGFPRPVSPRPVSTQQLTLVADTQRDTQREKEPAVSASGVCLTRGTAVWIRDASAPNPKKKGCNCPRGGWQVMSYSLCRLARLAFLPFPNPSSRFFCQKTLLLSTYILHARHSLPRPVARSRAERAYRSASHPVFT